jgi:hypothetical protein
MAVQSIAVPPDEKRDARARHFADEIIGNNPDACTVQAVHLLRSAPASVNGDARVRVPRRAVLRTGALAALVTGLLGHVSVPWASAGAVSSALPARTPDSADPSVLESNIRRLAEYSASALCLALDARDQLLDTLTPGQVDLFDRFNNLIVNHEVAEREFYLAELARHFPAVAPELVETWEHVLDNDNTTTDDNCCARVTRGFAF